MSMNTDAAKLANDPTFTIQFARGDPFPALVPQNPKDTETNMRLTGVTFNENKRFLFKKAHFSDEDQRVFDVDTGKVILVSHHEGKNPYDAVNECATGERKSGTTVSSVSDSRFLGFKIRPKTLSLDTQYVRLIGDDQDEVFNVAKAKKSKLRSRSARPSFVVGRGKRGKMAYRIEGDIIGTLSIQNKNGEVVAVMAKTKTALLKTAVYGDGSESIIDVAPGVDCSTILAIVFAIGQLGAHYIKGAFSNFVQDPIQNLVASRNHTTASDSVTENKNEGAEEDDSRTSTESTEKNSQTRSLRLGSFDFDNPEANTSTTSNGQSSTARSFPPLFHEAGDMLNLSNLIYTLVGLRNLARKGILFDPDVSKRILDMPLPGMPLQLTDALIILSTEEETLKKAWQAPKHVATLSALSSLLARQNELATTSKWQGGVGSSVMTVVGDSNNLTELVYAVGINSVEERITLTFRGSVTTTDWMMDAKYWIIQAPDPRRFNHNASDGSDGGNVGIHQGYYKYLFGDSQEKPSRYAEIMDHIEDLFKDPDRKTYKLYVTGHSMGGALATLFGFYAAGSPSLPLPVTVVSVASPRVGNINFARTFVELESQGKLRHLRIANRHDPITLVPIVSSKPPSSMAYKASATLGFLAKLITTGNAEDGEEGEGKVYYHTGMEMTLFEKGTACTLSYSGARLISGLKNPDADDVASNKSEKTKAKLRQLGLSYHFGNCYSKRMALAGPDLKDLTLNNLYRENAGGKPLV